MTVKVFYVSCNEGDWCGLYLNGKLFHEGHSISAHEWMLMIESLASNGEYYDADNKFGENLDAFGGHFPQELEDLLEYINEEV